MQREYDRVIYKQGGSSGIRSSMSGHTLATHQMLSTKSNDEEYNRGVNNSKQEEGMIPLGKAIVLLDLIIDIEENAKCLN